MEEEKYTGSYHDGRTEVLTEDGWKVIRNVKKEDKIAFIDNINHKEILYDFPLRILSKKYEGDMIAGKGRFLGFKVTPDYKLFIRIIKTPKDISKEKIYEFTIMQELPPFFKMIKYKNDYPSYYGEYLVYTQKDIHVEKYKGFVYSIESPSHYILLTRRNGKILISE
jgi:hypothetical protein